MKSLNARFQKEFPVDQEFPHPRGFQLARKLQSHLGADEWVIDEIETWRDSGWSLTSQAKRREIRISFSSTEQYEWILQISPQDSHGLIGSLFGAKQGATDENILQIGVLCDKVLKADFDLKEILWCWDAFPEPKNATREPQRPQD
ncbi:MAG: hypothetical protein AAGB46_11085 [Verrucomicrobiota bacterium]